MVFQLFMIKKTEYHQQSYQHKTANYGGMIVVLYTILSNYLYVPSINSKNVASNLITLYQLKAPTNESNRMLNCI